MLRKAIRPACILIAEDDESNRKVTSAMLRHLGYRADAVSNGREALRALKNQHYDIILMNLCMPEMGGLEASRLIRKNCPLSQQPKIIALTAYILPNSREMCIEAGMNDFMPKPFKVNELEKILNKHMRIIERQTALILLHGQAFKASNYLQKNRKPILPVEQDCYIKN